MKSAIGNALLTNLVIIFVSLVILFFVGILAYSKAYKVKNRIIYAIEESGNYDSSTINDIEVDLKNIGYQSGYDESRCNAQLNKLSNDKLLYKLVTSSANNSYRYCVFEVCKKDKDSSSCKEGEQERYYRVTTYVHFEFPVIGTVLNIPVSGETKILGREYDY